MSISPSSLHTKKRSRHQIREDEELEEEDLTSLQTKQIIKNKSKSKHNTTEHDDHDETRKHDDDNKNIHVPSKKKSKTTNTTASSSILPVQETNMFQYVHFKILDSIGFPGAYRKFMMKRKDQGAQWAIEMNEHIAQVHSAIKELTLLEQVNRFFNLLLNIY
jgi:hypothetical protein